MKSNFLKVRMLAVTYQRLKDRAAEAGKPISTFANQLLEEENSISSTTIYLTEIKSQLQELAVLLSISNQSKFNCEKQDLAISEILLIIRELAIERNAQILNKVSAQIKNHLQGELNAKL